MCHSLISRSDDLRSLVDDGYEVAVCSEHLVVRQVPYVTGDRKVARGTLISTLKMNGNITSKPDTHVVMFVGNTPCDQKGNPLTQIVNSQKRRDLGGGLIIDFTFSSKPPGGYSDYYEKMTTYATIISGPARSIDPNATARTFAVIEDQSDDPVFKYLDTASSRAGIGAVTEKLKIGSIAIVGLGGTGSYILDLVAKTPVKNIHLFDGDKLGQHNAFRSPGGPSIELLATAPMKAAYYKDLYSAMRHNIFDHGYVDDETVDLLKAMDFVFIAVDKGRSRRFVSEKLEKFGVPFIDVGMGVLEVDGALVGQVRVTLSTDESRDRVRSTLPLEDNNGVNEYAQNIQIADLNALNATLAVIKWKKCLGFYADIENEHSSLYQIDGNFLVNSKQ